MRVEEIILSNLVLDETFIRQVLPYIKTEYFSEKSDQIIFQLTDHFFTKYSKLPSKEALLIDIQKIPKLSQDTLDEAVSLIEKLNRSDAIDNNWLLENTEKFCKDRALKNAIMKSLLIYDDKEGKLKESVESLPSILTEALSVSFDQNIGHDYLGSFEDRWEYYTREDVKIPFELDLLNKITNGGLPPKTLSVILAGIGVGKSLTMGAMAAYNLMQGYNVLYITMELSEEAVSQRVDANLLDIDINEIKAAGEKIYKDKATALRKKARGRFIIKEYPTVSINVNHIRHLLQELKLKKNFVPDIIYIDYINIMLSARIKAAQGANSYTIIKSIAEELRGLAVEMNLPIVTATQLTRSGFASSDVGLEDTAESFGLPATADLFLAITQTEELKQMKQYLVKQLKNRLGDPGRYTRFLIGVDVLKMRLHDVDQGSVQHEEPVLNKNPILPKNIDPDKSRKFK